MRTSIIPVDISDSGFLAGVKVFWSREVSTLLWSWGVGWQKVTDSSIISSFLSWLLSTMTLGILSSFRSALFRKKGSKPDVVFLLIIKFSFIRFVTTLSIKVLSAFEAWVFIMFLFFLLSLCFHYFSYSYYFILSYLFLFLIIFVFLIFLSNWSDVFCFLKNFYIYIFN